VLWSSHMPLFRELCAQDWEEREESSEPSSDIWMEASERCADICSLDCLIIYIHIYLYLKYNFTTLSCIGLSECQHCSNLITVDANCDKQDRRCRNKLAAVRGQFITLIVHLVQPALERRRNFKWLCEHLASEHWAYSVCPWILRSVSFGRRLRLFSSNLYLSDRLASPDDWSRPNREVPATDWTDFNNSSTCQSTSTCRKWN